MSSGDFEFEGIQETPIPDMFEGGGSGPGDDFEEGHAPGVVGYNVTPGGATPMSKRVPGDSGISTESVAPTEAPSEAPQQPVPRQQRRPAPVSSGVPDPSKPVQRPEQVHRDYDAASAAGARQARTQQVHQGYSQPGQSVQPSQGPMQQGVPQGQQGIPIQAQGQPRRRPPNQAQGVQPGQAPGQAPGQMSQGQPMGQQSPQPGQPGFVPPQYKQGQGVQPGQMPPQGKNGKKPKQPKPPKGSGGPKKKLPIIPIIGVVVLLIVLLVGGKMVFGKKPVEPMVQNYETSGRYALDTLKSALNNYDPEAMDAVVGAEEGDSYLAQEWAYVNNVKIRQEFLQTVGAVVKFEYPKVQQLSTDGQGMVDDAGNPIMIESYMNAGEEFTVTIPDYDKLAKTMDEKAEYILKMLESAGYSENDYTYVDELTNLMLQFVLDDGPLPTKTVTMTLPVRLSTDGKPYIESDAVLDDLLFGSEEFHYMLAKFSQICVGWTGYIDEVYLTYEREHNEEYDRWLELFLSYFEADGGIYDPDGDPQFTNVQKSFKKGRSKWEPWYLRDDNNVIQKHPDGTYIVNYFSVKDENGNDWIQPAAEIEKEVENVRKLEDPWVEETGIWYNWCGLHFLETYTGPGSTVTRVGDGSRERPAGIGTTIITKVLGTDGMYHDVKVALMGYWTGQGAIDYAEKFSSKNRGFTTASVVQLICYEVYVENLESEPIEFLSSEMTLTDRNSNISSRTGTMYGFTDTVTLEGRGSKTKGNTVILNDWATSTELAQKYVCWGKSFGRQFSMVYFDCLAGTGEIPSYSAYHQFTGQSSIDEDITEG